MNPRQYPSNCHVALDHLLCPVLLRRLTFHRLNVQWILPNYSVKAPKMLLIRYLESRCHLNSMWVDSWLLSPILWKIQSSYGEEEHLSEFLSLFHHLWLQFLTCTQYCFCISHLGKVPLSFSWFFYWPHSSFSLTFAGEEETQWHKIFNKYKISLANSLLL